MLSLAEIYYRNTYEVVLSNNTRFIFSLKNYKPDPFFTKPFAIITAENPHNIDVNPEQNRERNALLYSELNSSEVLTAKGCYLEHCEVGYLIYDMSLKKALALGRKYEQVAIFYNDTKVLMYVDCIKKSVICEKKVD